MFLVQINCENQPANYQVLPELHALSDVELRAHETERRLLRTSWGVVGASFGHPKAPDFPGTLI